MRITIEFDSCWQTGFLSGDPNKPVSRKDNDRAFVATSKTRGEKYQPITLDTILGVLSRLIGDQRKLYQAKLSDFYFDDIKNKIDWIEVDNQSQKIEELTYLTNKSDDRCAQSSYLGVLDDDNAWFFSKNSHLLWSILFLTKTEIIDFILSKKINELKAPGCDPKSLLNRVTQITNSKIDAGAVIKTSEKIIAEMQLDLDKKENTLLTFIEKIKIQPPKTPAQESKNKTKLVKLTDEFNEAKDRLLDFNNSTSVELANSKFIKALDFLSLKYPDEKKLGEEYCKNGVVYPAALYSAALYLQAEYILAGNYDMQFLLNSKGDIQIQGFSKRGFNGVRDWLNSMTGKRKKSVGTPCVVNKHSGKLEVELSLDKQEDKGKLDKNISRAKEIAQLIENAGVSSFYLGKKGLAYVTRVRA